MGLTGGGRVMVMDLGGAVVLLPSGTRERLLSEALSDDDLAAFVRSVDDPDLASS